MNIDRLKKQVLGKIKPKKEEEKKVRDFSHKILDMIQDIGHEAVIVGSIGKHTWLRGDHDIDIFVLFSKDLSREQLEKEGLNVGQIICKRLKSKPVRKYAEHPYTQTSIGSYKIDIVPCYRIDFHEKIISAVDRSPLHLRYVLENLKPDQRDEVRLLKQFFKGLGVYGSDVKRLGFSGYVCELLIIIYGDFVSVLEDAQKWNLPQVLNMEKKLVNSLPGPLYLSDPVDLKRNAAAAVNPQNLIKLITYSKEFLEKPSTKYFFPNKTTLSKQQINKLKNRETHYVGLYSKRPDVINDTFFPQLRKSVNRIETIFKQNDFIILSSLEYADNKDLFILFEFETPRLSSIKQMIGPPVYSKVHSEQFLSKYKNPEFGPHIINDRWVAEIKREYVKPEELLKSFLKSKDLKEKGIPDNLAKPLRNAKMLKSDDVWKMVKKNNILSDFIRKKYFEKVI